VEVFFCVGLCLMMALALLPRSRRRLGRLPPRFQAVVLHVIQYLARRARAGSWKKQRALSSILALFLARLVCQVIELTGTLQDWAALSGRQLLGLEPPHTPRKPLNRSLTQREHRFQLLSERRNRPFAVLAAGKTSEALPMLYPFREHLPRLLSGDVRNVETMEPFATLHLSVARARRLQPCVFSFASEFFIQVFVNDVLKAHSQPVLAGSRPEWNFETALEIYSPFTIVRVAVSECNLRVQGTEGFVEFRAGDLEPNAKRVSGWFELRPQVKLEGKADARLAVHRRMRDSAVASAVEASELHMSMRLSSVESLDVTRPPHPSWASLISQAIFLPQRLGHLRLTDEWYACCFPRPHFEEAEHAEHGWLYLKDLKGLQDQVVEATDIVMNQLCRKAASVVLYVVGWRCRRLSLVSLLAFWVMCLWPWLLLPVCPLLVAFWAHLLRSPAWRRELLLHAATAPLNSEGLSMVASINRSEDMLVWLERLVHDRGGHVKAPQELLEFTKLVFHDGEPTLEFQTLIEELRQKRWISWRKGRAKCCPEGHTMEALGSASYHSDHLWACDGEMCAARKRSLHLGVFRYHCSTCHMDLCHSCVTGAQDSMLSGVKVPVMGFETLRSFIVDNAELARTCNESLLKAMCHLSALLHPEQRASARHFDALCVLASLVLAGCILLLLHFSWLWQLLLHVWVFVAGTAFFTKRAQWVLRVKTVCQANRDYLALVADRGKDAGTWAFFTADAEE